MFSGALRGEYGIHSLFEHPGVKPEIETTYEIYQKFI
jgi:hypothetical protein